jgi:hypothetical protein
LAKLSAFYCRPLEFAARRSGLQLTVDFNDPLEQLRQIELSRG